MATDHTYSMRLVQPFLRLLKTRTEVPDVLLQDLAARDPDDRLSVDVMHELLRGAIVLTGDEYLGLSAARMNEPGDYGALEYAASTAQDGRSALEIIGRYLRLVNDAARMSIDVVGDRAEVRLEHAVEIPMPAEDFELAAIHVMMEARAQELMNLPYELHFVHPAPTDTAPYAAVFGPAATLRFSRPATGFSFPASQLDKPLPSADPKLHALVSTHAEHLLSELSVPETYAARTRALLTERLAGAGATLDGVAEALHMSPRTLSRRLADERTSFKELLEDTRRLLSLRYVGSSDLPLSEVAFLVGFSQVSAFHRAFKRWTGVTPLAYREAERSA